MSEYIEISSLRNLKVKEVKNLRDKRERDEKKLFLVEGYKEIFRALQAGVIINSLFFSEELFLKNNEWSLIQKIKDKGVEIFRCPKFLFEKIAYRERPDGLLAIAVQRKKNLSDLKEIINRSKNPFLVIAEHIEKPGNLGTILRSSDGVGVDAVVICDPCTDIFNPNVVRASIGSLFTQPVIEADSLEVISLLKESQIKIVATTPNCNRLYYEEDLKGPLALIVGTEQYGLTKEWLENSDIKVKIPMKGVADSLNVGAATTIVLYEALRQRSTI
jgi:RNA methyltransferase, TrmH family